MEVDNHRRRHMVHLALLGLIGAALLVLIGIAILGPRGLAGTPLEKQLLRDTTLFLLGFTLILFFLLHFVSTDLAAGLLLTFVTVAVGFSDIPYHVVEGRSVFWFALPIVAASMLIRPWASFVYAGLSSFIVIYVGMRMDAPIYNWVGLIGFFFLALISWISAATLEKALARSQTLSAAVSISEERYRSIFEHSLSGIGLHELIRDADGLPVDYVFIEINDAFEHHTGLKVDEILGRPASDVLTETNGQPPLLDVYAQVVDTGKPVEFEYCAEVLDRTYHISASRLGENQFMTNFIDISQRIRQEQERETLLEDLRRQTEAMSLLMDTVPVGVVVLSEEHRLVVANALGQEILEQAGRFDADVLDTLAGQPLDEMLHGPAQRYWQQISLDDRALEITVRLAHDGATRGWVVVIRDVTQERDFERRLQQQDRLAVIGQLAGGIAHDFNNLLTTILGFSEFALEGLDTTSTTYEDVSEVRSAALRAASLTQQLLAFSRRQFLQPRTVSLSETVQGMQRMLVGLLEEAIELEFVFAADLDSIRVDPVQLQQVIMNLCVNARDAMPQGGRLIIAAKNVVVHAPAQPPHAKIVPGRYVMLSVSDTGTGMSEEVLGHMFEPFFTTKAVGKGTGLGLATVYGIVRQSEGQINVTSVLGQGTTFRVYFQPGQDGARTLDCGQDADTLPRGNEVILLVEDEAAVRRLARRELEALGYTVLEAGRPSVALALSRAAQKIDLLLTDVVMPEMDGAALAIRIREQRPELRVLYVSGYTDRNLDQLVTPGAKARFLEKPYDSLQLAETVRTILDLR